MFVLFPNFPRVERSAQLLILLAGLAVCLSREVARAAPVTHTFLPSASDPAISDFNNTQFAVLDATITARGQLFLFLPGTGATPYGYRLILANAVSHGYHALGLMYPNATEVNSLCAGADCDCGANVRLETLDGTDRTTLVTVDRTNSIENRLSKAILYLQATYPTENWGQFLDGTGNIIWNKIAVSGHSQGAGYAGIIAKTYPVARSVMFAALDYCGAQQHPSNWAYETGATPPTLCFGLVHQQDPVVTLPLETQFWIAFGLPVSGPQVNVDSTPSPYVFTHQLVTNVTPSQPGTNSYHGSIVADALTPLNPDGTPVLTPVWNYLLTAGTVTLSTVQRMSNGSVVVTGVGLPGAANTVQVSDALQSWSTLGTAKGDANGVFSITDSAAAGRPQRFYRATAP